ncbi:Cytochrome b-c1 complex subunit 2 mitochondrial, partial [Caligus rogercresseyi]
AFKFIVGESRLETRDRNAYIYLASESPLSISGGSQEAVLADYLLSLILGKEIPIKRGSGTHPSEWPLYTRSSKSNTLLGASLITEAASAGKAIDVILSTLKGLKVTDMELKAAKKRALNDIYTISESSTDNLLEVYPYTPRLEKQILRIGLTCLDRVSLSDVQ